MSKKEIKKNSLMKVARTINELEAECSVVSLIDLIGDGAINYNVGKVIVNNKKETVTIIPADGGEAVTVRPTKGFRKDDEGKVIKDGGHVDKFDAKIGVGVALLKYLTGMTSSRYERRYAETLGVSYEDLGLELLDAMTLDDETWKEVYDKSADICEFEIELGDGHLEGPDCGCGCDCDEYDEHDDLDDESCYNSCEEEEEDPILSKYEEVKETVDRIASMMGKDKNSYKVELKELNGMPGIAITGDDDDLGRVLSSMLAEYFV